MILRLVVLTALVAQLSFCNKPNSVDEARLQELRDLEERAAQRDAETKASQLDADRQKLADDQAALEQERAQLAADREAARNDSARQAQLQEDDRRLQKREADQRAAQERADADERTVQAARDARDTKRATTSKNLDYFYTALDAQGDWMETGSYGYVWQPREARSPGWRPYTDGTWVYTDYGWTWNGNEPFGWATYHYGRWTRLQGRGWVWVPGSEWAPAWVSWRKSPQYVGWAPLPPEAYASNGFDAAADQYYDIGPASYSFVPVRSFGEPTYRGLVVEPERNFTIITETTNVTRMNYTRYGRETVYYNHGPDIDQLSPFSARPIPRYRLERESSLERNAAPHSIAGNVLRLLAPPIASAARPAAAPVKVTERLGAVPVERGWGTGGNADAFRNKYRQEAVQAEEHARQAPVTVATPRPFLATGTATPRPGSGHFGTGGGPKNVGTGGGAATPSPFGTSGHPGFGQHDPSKKGTPGTTNEPFRPNNGLGATPPRAPGVERGATPGGKPEKFPPLATPRPEKEPSPTLATPHPLRPETSAATPHPRNELPLATPHRTNPELPLATPRPKSELPLATPRPKTDLPLATPKRANPELPLATPKPKPVQPFATPNQIRPETPTNPRGPQGAGEQPLATPRVKRSEFPQGNTGFGTSSTPKPNLNPPPSLPMERPRKATGSDGAPVIPAATPRKGPPMPDGAPDPRKTVPPGAERGKPEGAPTASPTPKKKKD